jgi:hypothetical protein
MMGRPTLNSVGRVRHAGGSNTVWDGNSLFAGVGASSGANRVPEKTGSLAPLAGTGSTVVNLGVSGQTWRQMDGLDSGNAADVDAAWVAGKTNILIVWETTNAVFNAGRTGIQAAQDEAQYIADRKAVHPWKVVALTTIPRQNADAQATLDAKNAELVAADNYMRRNYRSMGIDVLVDLRAPGSPFAFANYLPTTWDAQAGLWNEASGGRVHLSDAGYLIVAQMVASGLRRIPIR